MKPFQTLMVFYLFFLSTYFISCKEPSSTGGARPTAEIKPSMESPTDLSDAIISTKEDEKSKPITSPTVTPPKELYIKVDNDSIFYQSVAFFSTQELMESKMGKPDSIIEPQYECGPFSEDWQGVKFFQYFYGNMNFIISDRKAEIQNIFFLLDERININGIDLDGTMTLFQVAQKLGIDTSLITTQTRIVLYPKATVDEWYYLEFEKDRLIRFDRYAPC